MGGVSNKTALLENGLLHIATDFVNYGILLLLKIANRSSQWWCRTEKDRSGGGNGEYKVLDNFVLSLLSLNRNYALEILQIISHLHLLPVFLGLQKKWSTGCLYEQGWWWWWRRRWWRRDGENYDV